MASEISHYGIFTNKLNNKKLVYYPVPKNANTSAKLFFLKHLGLEKKFIFFGDDQPQYKIKDSQFKNLNKMNIVNFLPTKQKFSPLDIDEKCCLIRDPLKRFESAYKNRILYHKDKEFFQHSVDQVLYKLENNIFENKHFLPQSYFLGNNLNYYTIIGKTSSIFHFEEKINNFFGQKISFPKIQTGGNNLKVSLNVLQINKIKKIYEEDYFLIKDYI